MFSWYTQRRDFGGLSKRDLILKGVFAFEKAIALNAETISKCQLQIELMEAQVSREPPPSTPCRPMYGRVRGMKAVD
jgi:hypothetical protein